MKLSPRRYSHEKTGHGFGRRAIYQNHLNLPETQVSPGKHDRVSDADPVAPGMI